MKPRTDVAAPVPRVNRWTSAFGLILACVIGLALVAPQATGASPEPGPDTRMIVLFEDEPAVAALDQAAVPDLAPAARARLDRHRASVRAVHHAFASATDDLDLEVRMRHEFTFLVNAVAVTVAESDVEALSALPGVSDVVPDGRVQAATDVSVPLIGAPEVWERSDPDGVNVRGEGTTVAVLDTGIDYTNPSLGGSFGPGNKVVAGYDYVNGDDDPMDDNGHGTHVAGIIAGDGDVVGVAPAASLTAYKVLGRDGGGWESDIIAALEDAVDPANPHRADVVNLSLGGVGDGTDPLGAAASAAVDAGAVVVAAAGNSGPGAQTVLTPAAADRVLAVGASTSGLSLPSARMASPREEPINAFRAPHSASAPVEPVTGELVDVGNGTEADYDEAGDVTGKVVAYRAQLPQALRYVTPAMIEQAKLAEDRGAIGLLGYSESAGPFQLPEVGDEPAGVLSGGTVDVPLVPAGSEESFRMDSIVVMGLLDLQWPRLARDLADGPVEITISGEDVTDRVASFSSRGPTSRFTLKPELVAPGVEIRSTWPLQQWKPGVYRTSGTSMAAPHAAGAAALLRQLDPDASADTIQARLVGSAAAVDDVGSAVTGSGRLDVAAAADARLVAEPTVLSLGVADLSADTVGATATLTLRNDGDADLPVALRAEQAPDGAGTAVVTPAEAVVPAAGELEVSLTLSADRPEQDIDYSGWIVADVRSAATLPSLRVPYLLAGRPLVVQVSPDPSDGRSEAFVWSPAPLPAPPVVTVTPPKGKPVRVTAEHDHDQWYRATLDGGRTGAYQVSAEARVSEEVLLTGVSSFEVAENRAGGPSPMDWSPIGPNGAGGPMATTPADEDVVVVNQYVRAGPWRTEDGGDTWRQHNRLPVAGGTGSTVIDAADPDTMWYAVNGTSPGGHLLDPTYQGRLLRTWDGGTGWQILDFPDVHVDDLVSDADTRVLVAVTAGALMVSRDGGHTWSAHPNPAGSGTVGAAFGGDDLYVASRSAVWAVRGLLTGDPAMTDVVYEAADGHSERVAGMVADDELVAALIGGVRVIGSTDGGSSWQEIYDVPEGGGMSITMRDGDLMVATYRQHNHVGRDHGTSWAMLPQPVGGAVEDDVARWPGGGLVWSSPSAGMFHTDDDGAAPRRIGVQGLTVYDMAVLDHGGTPRLLAGTDSEIYDTDLPMRPRLEPDVAEWGLSGAEAHFGTRIGQLAVSPSEENTLWKIRKDAVSEFWVYRSTDGGEEWELRGRTVELPYDLHIDPVDPDRVVVPFWSISGPGLYVTEDAGEQWRKLFHAPQFTAVAADAVHEDRLWLASPSGLYRSDDFGETVELVFGGHVAAVEVDGDKIVAGGTEIRVSDDAGETFVAADSGGLDMLVTDLLVSPGRQGTWYAATGRYQANGLVKGGRGVLRSTDGGLTWGNVSRGLQNLDVESLEISPDGRWLFAGTNQGGVHRVRAR
ncbi:S8 family serine peptidase [Phytoactinopolyspora alkaliphila]|uniref:S8 family serine peptidase n=1 Tax=Phytoactinopolyspora alkaliphila TaxID=1783498 RepID=A0A6N9YJM3_9ACTN|nr:S8 family serine peptidase [Phytoactinopolyspora alkaliphila]NED95120.1 S8 family serine peptidase [Phytoactinopolyspora alkaliphila]